MPVGAEGWCRRLVPLVAAGRYGDVSLSGRCSNSAAVSHCLIKSI